MNLSIDARACAASQGNTMSDTREDKPTIKDIGEGISDIEMIIGLEKVLILSRELGGTEVRFPHNEDCDGFKRLAALIGGESVKEVARLVGINCLYIPMLSSFQRRIKHRKIIQRYEELLRELGRTRAAGAAVAKEFGHSERWVRQIVNR